MITVSVGTIGPAFFGLVVGWMTCRVHHQAKEADIKWLGAVIGTIGGGAVTSLFPDSNTDLFGWYCIGLAIGFFMRPVFVWIGTKIGIPSVEDNECQSSES